MVKFLVLSSKKDGVDPKELAPYVEDETFAAWELQKKGIIREANFRKDRPGVVLILECKDAEEAKKEMETLPMVAKGLVVYELIELAPYTGYEKIFKKRD